VKSQRAYAGHVIECIRRIAEDSAPGRNAVFASRTLQTDGHPHALSFLGSVFGAKTVALGVDQYGQSGSRQDLYNYYQIGLRSILQAVVEAIG